MRRGLVLKRKRTDLEDSSSEEDDEEEPLFRVPAVPPRPAPRLFDAGRDEEVRTNFRTAMGGDPDYDLEYN